MKVNNSPEQQEFLMPVSLGSFVERKYDLPELRYSFLITIP